MIPGLRLGQLLVAFLRGTFQLSGSHAPLEKIRWQPNYPTFRPTACTLKHQKFVSFRILSMPVWKHWLKPRLIQR
jgi:hypothetical protein